MGFLEWVLLSVPAYVANALPVLFSGRTPLDQGFHFTDGARFLGKSKTFRGFVAGVAGGTLIGVVLAYETPAFLPGLTLSEKAAGSFLLSIGAMLGDALGSFIKRRLGMASGQKAATDAVTFIWIALALLLSAYPQLWPVLGWWGLAFVLALTIVLHRAFNWIAHRLELKGVPW